MRARVECAKAIARLDGCDGTGATAEVERSSAGAPVEHEEKGEQGVPAHPERSLLRSPPRARAAHSAARRMLALMPCRHMSTLDKHTVLGSASGALLTHATDHLTEQSSAP